MLLINGQRAGEEFQRATTSPCSTARTPRLEVASSWPWRLGERRIVIKGIRLVGKPLALPGLDGRRHIAERLQKRVETRGVEYGVNGTALLRERS